MNINWLTSLWRPKINTQVSTSPIAPNLWEKCPGCGEMEYHKNWKNNLYICNKCQYHRPLSASSRFDITFDSYEPIPLPKTTKDPIKFIDKRKYTDRIKELEQNGLTEAISLAQGLIDGKKAIVAAMDFAYIGGSMGTYVGQAIVTACNLATSSGTPLICFSASGGARMQEGMFSLMQMPRTTLAVEKLKATGVPFIVVLTHPSMGGVLASFAMLGDITLAEPGATIGFSGRRVIEGSLRQTLPDDFQTSQFQFNCGFVDQIIDRAKIKHKLGQLLGLLT